MRLDTRTIQPVASCYTYYATLAHVMTQTIIMCNITSLYAAKCIIGHNKFWGFLLRIWSIVHVHPKSFYAYITFHKLTTSRSVEF